MKTHTEEKLQAAIDAAFPMGKREDGFNLDTTALQSEAPNRLAIAKAFLEKLEPDPFAELKKAHAEGKVIQFTDDVIYDSRWVDCPQPFWLDKDEIFKNPRYRIKPDEPSTLEAHGKTWTKHKAGDPMPCDGEAMVEVLLGGEILGRRAIAKVLRWESYTPSADIIGWRYADEPMSTKPNSLTPWTPAVGDVV